MFDTTNNGKAEFKEKASKKCKDLMSWLYLVATKYEGIKPTPVTGCSSMDVIALLNDRGKACLGPAGSSPTKRTGGGSPWQEKLTRPLEQLAAASASNQDILQKLTQIHAATEAKSSKSFQKIPTKYQNMILVASSMSEVTLVEVNPQAAEFFKSQNVLHANIMLNSLLEMEQIDCSISNAMTTSLWHGSLLWANLVTPSGLACSVITIEDFLRTDTLHDDLVLDYSTKFKMNPANLEKLTKT